MRHLRFILLFLFLFQISAALKASKERANNRVLFDCGHLRELQVPDLYNWLSRSGSFLDPKGILALDGITYENKLQRLAAFCRSHGLERVFYSDTHLAKNLVSSLFYSKPFKSSHADCELSEIAQAQQETSWAFAHRDEDREVLIVKTQKAPLQWQETCLTKGESNPQLFTDCFASQATRMRLKFRQALNAQHFQIEHGARCLARSAQLAWEVCNASDETQYFVREAPGNFWGDTFLQYQLRHVASQELLFDGAFIHVRDAFDLLPINKPLSVLPTAALISERKSEASAKPDIYLIWLDTIRADVVDPSVMPHLYAFSKESIGFEKNFASGSSTRPTAYAVWNSRPPTEWKYALLNDPDKKGSINLRILHRLGYKVRGVGQILAVIDEKLFDANGNFFDETQESLPKASRGRHVFYRDIFEFQKATSLRTIDQKCALSDEYYRRNSGIHNDNKVVDCFLYKLAQKRTDPHAFLLWLQGAHVPYMPLKHDAHQLRYPSFAPFLEDSHEPVHTWLWNNWYYGQDTGIHDKDAFVNSYLNAANSADKLFGRVVEGLKKSGAYDNAIIVVMSDHGEALLENGTIGHGGTTLHKVVDAPIFYHFPKGANTWPVQKTVSSHMDIFPTLFDHMGIRPQDAHVGTSIFKPGSCYISVQPNGYDYQPIEFSIFNGTEKLRARFRLKETTPHTYKESENPLASSAIEVIAFTDYWDTPLKSSSVDEIQSKFDDCLATFFGRRK